MSELIKRQDAIDAVSRQYRYESDRMTALQNVVVVTEQEIRAKAIEEFASKMKWEYENSTGVPKKEIEFAKAVIDMVAEKMKGGAV